jgi:hypothetical protein
MPFAVKNFAVQDEAGNALTNVTVEVRREEPGQPLVPLYADRDGLVSLGNPFVAASGAHVKFYAAGGAYQIKASVPGLELIWRHEGIGLAGETDFGGGDDSSQVFTGATGVIGTATTFAIVSRVAPATTGLTLPDASLRNKRPLHIGDHSTSVTNHTITCTPFQASQKINRQSTLEIRSNASNLAGVTLYPVIDPDNSANYVWLIAP